ncbi:GNAT family N-acetyltransferase [Aeromonas taiwanensis]|uniref:GNAT family N-acetyltransferase n=1 Tax=Aeromonas taiwanensis TaxID=633417 RepID=UPI0005C22533|nr:GNAT family N-acetyltransferase [Aeromonas taiwanensis]
MPTLTVSLIPLHDADFPAYRDYFIEDYARDLASNHGMALPDARRQADASLQQLLPQGVATPGHHLLALVPEDGSGASNTPGEPLGYLWHAIDSAAGTTFIYDFYVTPPHRGQGFGKAAMVALEAQLVPLGIHQIKLRVAHDNPRALALYQALGFTITGYNMAKHLG